MGYRKLKQRVKYWGSTALGFNERGRDYEWAYGLWDGVAHLRYRRRGAPQFRTLSLRDNRIDLEVFLQTFQSLQFDTQRFPQHRKLLADYRAILERGNRPLIIDAGAHVGLAALYFLDQYPEAVVVSVEPEQRNYAELIKNLAGDARALPLHAALAGTDGFVEIENPEDTSWGFRTRSSGAEAKVGIPALGIPSVIERARAKWPVEPFIAKIDIEGFEKDVFSGDVGWVDSFSLVSVELHDWMLPGQNTSRPYLKAISNLDRDNLVRDENLLSFRC